MAHQFDAGDAPGEKKSLKEKMRGPLEGLLGGKQGPGGPTDVHPSKETGYGTTGVDPKSEVGSHGTASENMMPTLSHGEHEGVNVYGAGSGTDSYGTGNHRINTDSVGPGPRGTGPQEIVGKFEDPDRGVRVPGDRVEPGDGRVDNFEAASKPKIDNSYETWIKEGRPQLQARVGGILQARVGGILQDRTEAGFERRLTESDDKPSLEAQSAVDGDATNDESSSKSGKRTFLDKVKDTVTGQAPSHGIASGTATLGDATAPQNNTGERILDPVVQDVGMGGGAAFNSEKNGVPGHNPQEDRDVLDGHDTDPVDRMRHTVIGEHHGYGGDNEAAITAPVTSVEGGLPRHPRMAHNPEEGPRSVDGKKDGRMAKLMDKLTL